MPRGGAQPGAGRPRGKRSRHVIERELLAAKGLERALQIGEKTPLEVMLARMHGDATVTDEIFQAAIAAAPYIHPRLASSDTTIKSDNTHRVVADKPMTIDEWQQKFGAQHANDAATTADDDLNDSADNAA